MSQRQRMFAMVSLLLIFALGCGLVDLPLPEGVGEGGGEEATPSFAAPTETSPPEPTETPSPEPTTTPTPKREEPTREPSPDRPLLTREPPEINLPGLGGGTAGSGATLEIINETEAALTELYISPVTSSEWGENWLQAPLEIGGSLMLTDIEEDDYDIQAGNTEAEVSETLYSVTLEGEKSWTVVGTATVPDEADLRFEDDFSDNRNGWGGVDDGEIHYRAPADGEFCLEIRVAEMTAWEWYEPFRTAQFFTEVKCTVDPTTDASCGLGYGADGDNLVWYEIDASTQSYALFFSDMGTWSDPLIGWTEDQHISPSGTNYMGLGRLENVLFVYINGVLVDHVEAELFADGRVGIGGATYSDPEVTVCLDDLRVWQISTMAGTEAPDQDAPPAATAEPEATTEPAANAPLAIVWEGPMGYEGREGETRWCEMKMTYRNLSGANVNWPDYRPLFLIRNGDGSEDGWYYANYYHKEDGWENGIEGEPPTIPPGQGANWTWYSFTDRADQYCASIAVEYQGWIFRADYGPQGALINTHVVAP